MVDDPAFDAPIQHVFINTKTEAEQTEKDEDPRQ
jgi:hypothetical protein